MSRAHFVTLLSPGTFVDEQTTLPVDAWIPAEGVRLSRGVVERYGATPYGFYFSTRLVLDPVPDGEGGSLRVEPREVARSGLYHLTGRLRTLAEVERDARSDEEILRSNMSGGLWIVVECVTSYRSVHPFEERDVLLDAEGAVLERGDDPRHVAYRAEEDRKKEARFRAEWPDALGSGL